jgi:thymidylate synthase
MHIIDADNVALALPKGVHHLLNTGVREDTRAGECLVAPGPVWTRLRKPAERVLFSWLRDANPFFHLVESLWMLAGRDDAESLNRYVADFGDRFAESPVGGIDKAEKGGLIHGAYGHRWRQRFGLDQLNAVVKRLRADDKTRQCVVQMWDCSSITLPLDLGNGNIGEQELGCLDLTGKWRDRPCNTHLYLRIRRVDEVRLLDMTVCNRSHDIVWGLYGANAVHFSVLQEYLAARVGVQIGDLYFLSNNFHVYCDMMERLFSKTSNTYRVIGELHDNRYSREQLRPLPMFDEPEDVDDDLLRFFCWHDGVTVATPYSNRWFRDVAQQVVLAHRAYKAGETDRAIKLTSGIGADDWAIACREWIARRRQRKKDENDHKREGTQI